MATSKQINDLIINKIENQAVYQYMQEHGLINEDELYLVEDEGPSAALLYTAQTLTEAQKAQARANIGIDDAILAAITGAMEASY